MLTLREREAERGVSESDRTPVIAMTARAARTDRQSALDAGMDDWVSKPVRLPLLAETLGRRARDEGAADAA